MCGIAGAFGAHPSPDTIALVDAILAAQYHRGPDDTGREVLLAGESQLVLGHNRLAIIDLSVEANQPMWDAEHRVCTVFNGEIYNYLELRQELVAAGHRFTTSSDTEVLLEAYKEWGLEALPRFLGMFAFALWDDSARELLLVRDRFGVKPLFWHMEGDELTFASTTTTLAMGRGLSINLAYAVNGIETGTYDTDEDRSPYLGLQALRPGHWLRCRVEEGRLRQELGRWYDVESRAEARREEIAGWNPSRILEEVRATLDDAVRLRLRADVPVGVSLSGGLDSTTVAGLMAPMHPGLTGFSFGHPDDPRTEGSLVQDFARHSGVSVVYIRPEQQDIQDTYWHTIVHQGAPFPGGSIVAQNFVFRTARAHGCIVMVGGQGGDEAFMGYLKYRMFVLREALAQRDSASILRYGTGAALAMAAESLDFGPYLKALNRYAGRQKRSALLVRPEGYQSHSKRYNGDYPVWKRQLLDVIRFSLPTLLRYEDRNSMGNSVESRLPFLDHRIIELGLATPEHLKVKHGHGKWIVRSLVKDIVPDSIRLRRRKKGFNVSENQWIRNGLGAAIRARLQDAESFLSPYVQGRLSVSDSFRDEQLIQSPMAMPEAMTLLWILSHHRSLV